MFYIKYKIVIYLSLEKEKVKKIKIRKIISENVQISYKKS